MHSIVGWDVGGAHLKAARVEDGRIVAVVQQPCPLWLGRDRLEAALNAVVARLGPAVLHAATMTGELTDVFESRAQGVAAIAAMLERKLGTVRVYAGRRGFVEAQDAAPHVSDVASANWHASAALAARCARDAVFVDMGSTTTDIAPLASGLVRAAGYTDAERLACGELVYTGLTRSFVLALGPRAPIHGGWVSLAGEYFASTADVYRVLGELPEGADQLPSADRRDKTVAASVARLARMVGRDAADMGVASWCQLAAWFAEAQLRQIEDGAHLVLSRAGLPAEAPVIGAGVGRRVIERLAGRLRRPYRDFADLLGESACRDAAVSDCAPAVAIALLAAQDRA
jgi:probable H4MPT-linked C1 transfer pathway protein